MLIKDLYACCSFLVEEGNGCTYYIQDYDGYHIENDRGEVVIEIEDETIDYPVINNTISIDGFTFLAYQSKQVQL